jgi:iron complex outermembrane recepter protein
VTQAPSLLGGSSSPKPEASDSDVNLKIHVAYDLGPDNLIYAQAAQGYRVGGINPPVAALCPAAAASYGPDSLWNYEIGSKNALLDRRLVVNAAAYYIEWADMQVTQTFPCGSRVVQNAGKSTSKGVELELQLRPLEHLDITSSVAYSKTKLTQVAPGVPYTVGSELPGVPEWTGYLAAQYSFPLAGSEAYVRLDGQYVDDSISDFDDTTTPASLESYPQESYSTVGLRLGVQARRWEASVFVNNAFDEKAHTFVRDLAVPGTLTSTVNRPQTIGVNLKARF